MKTANKKPAKEQFNDTWKQNQFEEALSSFIASDRRTKNRYIIEKLVFNGCDCMDFISELSNSTIVRIEHTNKYLQAKFTKLLIDSLNQ